MKGTVLFAAVLAAAVARAAVTLPDVFADHMVLQRNAAARIWGTAESGETVTVSFRGASASAAVDANGDWEVRLPVGGAEAEGADLVVVSAVEDPSAGCRLFSWFRTPVRETSRVVLRDVLVGEVWVAAGQSNMEFKLKSDATAREAIASSGDNLLRWFRPARTYSRTPLKDCKGTWTIASPETSPDYSAVGYFFAKELRAALKVPVAVMDTSVGCTRAQSWMSMATIRRDPVLYKPFIREYETEDCFSHCVRDPGRDLVKTKDWESPKFDASGWKDIDAPGFVFNNRITNYVQTVYGERMHGVFWFRRTFEVPAAVAGKDGVLDFGADDYDIAYLNGTEVGRTGSETAFPYEHRRNYPVPGRLVKAGTNVVAIRVHGEQHADGLWGKLAFRGADGREIDLAHNWKIRDEFHREGGRPVSAEKVEHMPAYFYNAMLGPIERFRAKGAIWYQGCCNARLTGRNRGGYPDDMNVRILSDMIGSWRAARGDAAFPVYMVQLAGFSSDWASYRECQRVAGETIPNCGTVTALDVGNARDIHPNRKVPVAHRLALRALHDTYGESVAAWRSPEVDAVSFADAAATLTVRYATALKTTDGRAPATFEIADAGGKFRPAVATLDGAKITVTPADAKKFAAPATGVRYGWSACPAVNVASEADLPLFAFEKLRPVTVVRDGQPAAKVYYLASEGAPKDWVWVKPDRRAPRRPRLTKDEIVSNYFCQAMFDLRTAVKAISGAELEFVPVLKPDEVKGPAVVIGRLAAQCGVKVDVKDDPIGETYDIRAAGERLFLAGNGKLGDVYAIYGFLNEQGAEWVMPDRIGFACEKQATIEVAGGTREGRPGFKVRAPWLSGGSGASPRESHEWSKWQIRNREQNRSMVQGLYLIEPSPRITWRGFMNKRFDKWFEEHPECAALQVAADGSTKRSRYQINLLAPASEELVANCVREAYKANGWKNDERHILNVEPSDGGGFDMSDAAIGCARGVRDPIQGDLDQTDAVFGFLGRVLDRVTNEFPNVCFDTLVYNQYADFPRKRPPHPHQALVVADITHSRYHGACDADVSPSRAYYRQVVEQWAKTGCEFTFYHYNWNLADALLPYTRLRIVGEDVPWEHSIGALGYQDEHLQGLSFSAPHDWLLAKLAWKPEKGAWKGLTERFCRFAYGDGWKEMYDYLMFLVEHQRNCGDESGAYVASFHMWTRADYERLKDWMTVAEAKAKLPDEKARVRVAAYAVDQLGRFVDYTEAFTEGRYGDALKAAESIQAAEAAAKVGEYPQMAARWTFTKYMLLPFAKKAVHYSTPSSNGNYRIVAEVPERMKFQYLPQAVGEKMNFQSPLAKDDDFPVMSTWKSSVSRQGMIGTRWGELWYRAKIRIPETKLASGEGIGLFIGGFDNRMTVYLNGVRVGRANGFASSAVFDVTDYLTKNGEENTLVLCVERNGNSEALTGGIIFPSWFFAGPRVPKAKDAPADFKIIIPGMAN